MKEKRLRKGFRRRRSPIATYTPNYGGGYTHRIARHDAERRYESLKRLTEQKNKPHFKNKELSEDIYQGVKHFAKKTAFGIGYPHIGSMGAALSSITGGAFGDLAVRGTAAALGVGAYLANREVQGYYDKKIYQNNEQLHREGSQLSQYLSALHIQIIK
jgi:hypothetical protein